MKYIEYLWNNIKYSEKICFFSGLFWGVLTHMYMLTNKLPNWDDLGCFDSYGVGSEFGRFLLKPLSQLTVKYSNPWVNGTIAIILLAVGCMFIYRLLGLESILSGILLSMVVMTFPALASTMTFMFTVDLYAISILFSILAAYMITREGFIPCVLAVIFLVVSLGIYQSYICFTITLLLLYILKELLFVENNQDGKDCMVINITRKQFLDGIKYAVFLLVSTFFYIVLARLRYPGLTSENYNGVGAMGSISLVRLPRLIAKAYLRFFRYFLLGDYSFISNSFQFFNICIIVVMAVCWIYLLYRIRQDRLRVIFAVLVTVLLPLGNSFVDVMAPDASFSMLMLYQYCLVYVALLGMVEMISEKMNGAFIRGVSVVAVLFVCVIGYKQYQLTGEAYFRMDIAYRRSVAYLQRIIMHVEEQEDYHKGDPIRILGSSDGDYTEFQNMDGKKYLDLSGVAMEYGMLTPGAREQFATIYLGVNLEPSYGYDAERIKAGEEYREMEHYPSRKSIRKIDGCWIVRLND